MHTKALIPLDGSRSSEIAVDEAVRLLPTLQSAHLVLVESRLHPFQSDGYTVYVEKVRKIREETGTHFLLPFQRKLEIAGIGVETTVLSGDPVRAIADMTRRESIDLILLGADGGWLERYFGPAHLANRLARKVEATVVTVRGGGRKTIHGLEVFARATGPSALAPRQA